MHEVSDLILVFGALRKILHPLGLAITRPQNFENLVFDQRELARMKGFHGFLSALTPGAMAAAVRIFPNAQGENFQDILVLEERANGFFVEFGATKGGGGWHSPYDTRLSAMLAATRQPHLLSLAYRASQFP